MRILIVDFIIERRCIIQYMAAIKDLLYYRYIIQKCVEFNKPMVVSCEYNGLCTIDLSKMTFRNITPYLPENYNASIIADHINLRKSECIQYMTESSFVKGHKFIIVAKPYIYKNKNGDVKGGLILSNELEKFGLKPILFYSNKYIKRLPYNLIIDFRKEFDGIYGWKKPTRYSIVLSSEQKMMNKNTNPNKLSFSISYSEDLNNSTPIVSQLMETNLIENEEKNDLVLSLVENEENIINTDIELSVSNNTINRNVRENLNNKKINVELNNITIKPSENKIRNIDNNINEYSSLIPSPDFLSPKIPSNDLVIPPYRRK